MFTPFYTPSLSRAWKSKTSRSVYQFGIVQLRCLKGFWLCVGKFPARVSTSKLPMLGMGMTGILTMGPYKPLLFIGLMSLSPIIYGNNGSLDPSTNGCFNFIGVVKGGVQGEGFP